MTICFLHILSWLIRGGSEHQTSNKVRFSVNSPPEDRLTLNQPSLTFRAPIRPPKYRPPPQKKAFPFQYFLSVNKGWLRAPNLKKSSVLYKLTP